MNQGICVKSDNVELVCYKSLNIVQNHLDSLREGGYAGAASVLTLLPTIGALLGAPTSDIWRLLTVIPFGGGLAMTFSFGGAILLVRVEDYKNDLNRHKLAIERSVAFRAKGPRKLEDAQEEVYADLDQVLEKILVRMRSR